MEKETSRVRSSKDIIISSIFIAAGIAFILANTASMIILGATLVLLGAILLITMKSSFKIGADSTRYKRTTLSFSTAKKGDVISFLEKKSDSLELDSSGVGSLMLYVWYDKPRTKGYARLYEYSLYEYHPCTEMIQLDSAQVKAIVK